MTEEEARAEAAEAERLINEIARLKYQIEQENIRQEALKIELAALLQNIKVLTQNVEMMDVEVNKSMEYIKNKISEADISTAELFTLIDDLTKSYFTFKNLSTASKKVTQFTDEYYTRFKYYNELRRITLGFVIGLDAHICSDEMMRKKVEVVYLQNTEYWLAYAIMAVMLWANNIEEAAQRAMSKALNMDYLNSSLFFLLINLRFTRVEAAKKWYLAYLDRADMENLGSEWKYLLQTYLSGVFGVDREFNQLVRECFVNMFEQMESMHPDYGKKVLEKTKTFSISYIHVSENEFEALRRNCTEYEDLKKLLSLAEKNEILTKYFQTVLSMDCTIGSDLFQRIETILYNLINAYDKDEYKVIKNKRYNEMIIKAKGDIELAQQFYQMEYPNVSSTDTLEDLLFQWAFEEDISQVDITVKQFAMSYLKNWIAKGFQAYADEYRTREKESYCISIDGWSKNCSEKSISESESELIIHYNKNRIFDTIKDKYVMIFGGLAIATILILLITAFHFNAISLVIGVLLGIVSGFLLWRRITDMQSILKTKREMGCLTLKKTLEDLRVWRELFQVEDSKNSELVNLFKKIEV